MFSEDNPLQFAVVREDPLVEAEILRRHASRKVLLVASGGCTALTLQSLFPDLDLTLVDPNAAQMELIRAKLDALESLNATERFARFNVGNDDPGGLNEGGNFESLFRNLRTFLFEFVLPRESMFRLFEREGALVEAPELLFSNPRWSEAFRTYFSDTALEAMFGANATQYAEPGSYATYFQRVFEQGLLREDARDNPFLHHMLLGHYLDREECLPQYLVAPAKEHRFTFVHGLIEDSVDLSAFDMVDLSNILDWMNPGDVTRLIDQVRSQLRPGAVVLWRQLNNERNMEGRLSDLFAFDSEWQASLHERDRSLFYSSLHVGIRR